MPISSLEDFVATLVKKLSSGGVFPPPTHEDLRELILTSFWASTSKEERRAISFALAFVDDKTLAYDHSGLDVWCFFKLKNSLSFDVPTLTKLAPTVDPTYCVIAVQRLEGELRVVGLVRTSRSKYRFDRQETTTARLSGWNCLVIKVLGPGNIAAYVGDDFVTSIERGAVNDSKGAPLLRTGVVLDALWAFARLNHLDEFCYLQVIHRLLLRLMELGHGGIVVLQKGSELNGLGGGFPLDIGATNLNDAARALAGQKLATFSISSSDRNARENPDERRERLKREDDRNAVKSYLENTSLLDDAAAFAANLASIDGALVIRDDLTTLTFGAHITFPRLGGISIAHVRGSDLSEIDKNDPLRYLGTRHNSAANFAMNKPGALVFVASEDSVLSVMMRSPHRQELLVWRPISLTDSWQFYPPAPQKPEDVAPKSD